MSQHAKITYFLGYFRQYNSQGSGYSDRNTYHIAGTYKHAVDKVMHTVTNDIQGNDGMNVLLRSGYMAMPPADNFFNDKNQ